MQNGFGVSILLKIPSSKFEATSISLSSNPKWNVLPMKINKVNKY